MHQARRHLAWATSGTSWAGARDAAPLPFRAIRHRSLLLRELEGAAMALQHSKVTNLRLASARVDGVLIRPGETFSFNRVVGSCTRRKGYVDGMRLSNGEARAGVGGGICQLANLLHWMFLHSPLTVVERSEHSFDPFPDQGRVLPWGVGCSIVYNYVDLVVRNDTSSTFQLLVRGRGALPRGRAPRPTPTRCTATGSYARGEQFLRHAGRVFRRNEIWRSRTDRRTGDTVGEELVKRNCALVIYTPTGVDIVDV